MRPELVFLSPFFCYEFKIDSFYGVKGNFEWIVFIKKTLISRKFTLKVNKIMPNISCSHKISILNNSSKKTKFRKMSLVSNSTLDELFNDTTHISLRRIYRSAKTVWTKKTHLSI